MTTRGSDVVSAVLKQAITNGDLRAVRRLVEEEGESLSLLFLDGSTPLGVAIAYQQEDIAVFLLDSGADPVMADSFRLDGCERQPVHYASASGMLPVLKRLLLEGADASDVDFGGSTLLHYAAESGHTDVIELLLSEGCELDAVSSSGHTPLGRAALGGHRQSLHLLFAEGAHVNVSNQVGVSLLAECVREGKEMSVLKDLLYFGADVHSKDIEGNTALHVAASFGRTEAGRFLIEAGIDIAKKNDYGNPALHNSTMHGHVDFSVLMLNQGADVTGRNQRGQSALYCSMLHQQQSSVILLHSLGAKLTAGEHAMYDRYEASRNCEKRDFYAWTNSLLQDVRSLKAASRIAVLSAVKPPREISICQLPVPPAVTEYLLLADHSTNS